MCVLVHYCAEGLEMLQLSNIDRVQLLSASRCAECQG